ncbi:hypothetical protein [Streptosporangium subroseum]|uniref:hypothetical protein n=1 Tax=Streptosporangium subroseum TaxID=106412 RepID=UPI003084772C|nr:hypothetical protein OHB15_14060 [Streptosporangium subroseum]
MNALEQGVLGGLATLFVLGTVVGVGFGIYNAPAHTPGVTASSGGSIGSASDLIQELKGTGYSCQEGGYGAAAIQNESVWVCGKATALFYGSQEAMDMYGGIAADINHGMNTWGSNGGDVFTGSAKEWDGLTYPTWEVMCEDSTCSMAAGKLGWQ